MFVIGSGKPIRYSPAHSRSRVATVEGEAYDKELGVMTFWLVGNDVLLWIATAWVFVACAVCNSIFLFFRCIR